MFASQPSTFNSSSPCGVVQSTRLPLMQEITGAKPVRDANPDWSIGVVGYWIAGQKVVRCEGQQPHDSITPALHFFSLPGRLIVGHRPLKATMVVRIHPRQPA